MSPKAKTVVTVISTPEDRQRHIDACKERDAESKWGLVPTPGYYEKLGDHASVNSWYYHDSSIGFNRLYANTPEWIVDLARKMRWISDRGEQALT
jgi:hypothetical protein